ncbi:MAG: DsbA family protein [Pseudomonadota bacterium]
MRHISACFAFGVALMAAPLAMAQDLSEERVKELVLEAILENPEVIMEAIQLLEDHQRAEQQAQAQALLDEQRDRLEQDPNAPVIGNVEGDVTVVEFFDYNCPYCRRAKEQLYEVLAADGNVRVVMREWPILGEESVFAARAALASREQGKYDEFHEALMDLRGRATEQSVLQLANRLGMDTNKLVEDMNAPEVQAHIDTSMELARSIGFSGTPSFIVGDTLVPGFVEAAAMADHIASARALN